MEHFPPWLVLGKVCVLAHFPQPLYPKCLHKPPPLHPSHSPTTTPPHTDYTHHHTCLRQSPFWCGCFRGQPSAAFWLSLFLYIKTRLSVEPCAGISMDSNSMMTLTLCVLHSLYLTVSYLWMKRPMCCLQQWKKTTKRELAGPAALADWEGALHSLPTWPWVSGTPSWGLRDPNHSRVKKHLNWKIDGWILM